MRDGVRCLRSIHDAHSAARNFIEQLVIVNAASRRRFSFRFENRVQQTARTKSTRHLEIDGASRRSRRVFAVASSSIDLKRCCCSDPREDAAQLTQFVIHFVRRAHRLHDFVANRAGELTAQTMDVRFHRA